MKDFPFSVYDAFAYLAAGIVVTASADYAFGPVEITSGDASLMRVVTMIVVAYTLGHVVAYLSGVGIEQHIFGKRLLRTAATVLETRDEVIQIRACASDTSCTVSWGVPAPPLNECTAGDMRTQLSKCRSAKQQACPLRSALQVRRAHKWRKTLFGFHFAPISITLRDRILNAAARDGVSVRALFTHAFMVARQDPVSLARASTFLVLYGFCRNMIIAALIAGQFLAFASARPFLEGGAANTKVGIAALATLPLAWIFTFRYLYFLKQFELEIYTTYAYSPPLSDAATEQARLALPEVPGEFQGA